MGRGWSTHRITAQNRYGLRGQFLRGYQGRVYGGQIYTEFLTVALEGLYAYPEAFSKQHPEMFADVVTFLRRTNRGTLFHKPFTP